MRLLLFSLLVFLCDAGRLKLRMIEVEKELEVHVDLVHCLHVRLELVHRARPEGDHRVAEQAEDGGRRRGGRHVHLAQHPGCD